MGQRVIYWAQVYTLAVASSKSQGGDKWFRNYRAQEMQIMKNCTYYGPVHKEPEQCPVSSLLRTDTCFSWSQHISKSIRGNIYPPSWIHNPIRYIQQTHDLMCTLKPNPSLKTFGVLFYLVGEFSCKRKARFRVRVYLSIRDCVILVQWGRPKAMNELALKTYPLVLLSLDSTFDSRIFP